MDDKNRGYRGGLYGSAENDDDFTPHISEPRHDTTAETFHDPLFEDDEKQNRRQTVGGKLALASMIIGIISVLMCACGYTALILGPVALVLGIAAKVILRQNEDPTAKNFALAGIVLGIIGMCSFGLAYFMGWTISTGQHVYEQQLHDKEQSLVG